MMFCYKSTVFILNRSEISLVCFFQLVTCVTVHVHVHGEISLDMQQWKSSKARLYANEFVSNVGQSGELNDARH